MPASFAFYLCEGFQLLDLAGPTAALTAANRLLGIEHYRIDLVSEQGGDVPGVNRRPKRTPYRRPKGTPFVERCDGYGGRAVRAGCGVGRA